MLQPASNRGAKDHGPVGRDKLFPRRPVFRVLDLNLAGLLPELKNDGANLGSAGGPDGMALRFEPPGNVDRQLSAQGGVTRFGKGASLSDRTEAEVLGRIQLTKGRGVMDLCQVDVIGTQAVDSAFDLFRFLSGRSWGSR